MADDEDWDDWAEKPTPMTAVAIRLEVDAVDAVRELAGDAPPAELLRRWVLERLAAERTAADEPAPSPPPAKKRAAAKKAPAAKKAAAEKAKPAKNAAKKRS